MTREEFPADMDPECIDLCAALCLLPGIETIESCCGHGTKPYRVWFTADSLESLPAALYWFDVCHCGFAGWRVVAQTDCSMSPATFMVEGPEGKDGYHQSGRIAEYIRDYVEAEGE